MIWSHNFHFNPLRLFIFVSYALPSRQLPLNFGNINLLLKHLPVHFLPHNILKIHLLLFLVKLVQAFLLLSIDLKVLYLFKKQLLFKSVSSLF